MTENLFRENIKPIDMFSGKRVCIVGPASYMDTRDDSSVIDGYDVVVRLIRSLPLPSNNLGVKTDVVLSSLIGDRGIFNIHDFNKLDDNFINVVKGHGNTILCPFPKGYHGHIGKTHTLLNNTNHNIDIIHYDLELFTRFKNNLNTHPTTGLAGIQYLLDKDLIELYVTGFTFNCNKFPRVNSYVNRVVDKGVDTTGWHSIEAEEIFFRNLVKNDDRITIDSFMVEHGIG